jgi:hypothetical protein
MSASQRKSVMVSRCGSHEEYVWQNGGLARLSDLRHQYLLNPASITSDAGNSVTSATRSSDSHI